MPGKASSPKKSRGGSKKKPPPPAPVAIGELTPKLASLDPGSARWIAALIRVTSPHPAMGTVLDVLDRLQDRPFRTNALLLGEPGTGKGGLARAMAHMIAPHGKAVRVDLCGYDDESALERLCGVGKTAGLVQEAHEGTLLIEEAADLSMRVQNELLRIMKTGKVRPRGQDKEVPARVCVVALSDRDLRGLVAAGQFRHDLYYRLARVVLWLPPLRERLEDAGVAAVWMGNRILQAAGVPLTLRGPQDMKRASADEQRRSIELAPAAIEALMQHTWPGNFRELEAVMERALLLFRTDRRVGADEIAKAMAETHG
ncbi:MAG: sigma 54-interacting transcriptional regulator [Deltaproteobacteria bacterium]|nr:sigma 54-interacting transcriptional regulator [Deltaproteobacteria bacterium]